MPILCFCVREERGASSIGVEVLDVGRLEEPDVPVVRAHGQEGVHVQAHPQPAAQGDEHHLQVDVVAEDEPQAEGSLKKEEEKKWFYGRR